MPVTLDVVALAVALASLVFSIGAWRRASRSGGVSAEPAVRSEPDQAQPEDHGIPRKAHVSVAVVGVGRNHQVVVSNLGPGLARHVTLSVEPRGEARVSPLVQADADEKLPIAELAAGDEVSLLASVSSATGTEFGVRAVWINEDGSREGIGGVLTAP